jgi:hypothetical protein
MVTIRILRRVTRHANTPYGADQVFEKRSVTKENTGCGAEKTRLTATNRANQGQTSLKGEAQVTGTS